MPNLWKRRLAQDHEVDELDWLETVQALERMEFADDMYGDQLASNGKKGRNADSSRNGEQMRMVRNKNTKGETPKT